jgi:hypothetical protein
MKRYSENYTNTGDKHEEAAFQHWMTTLGRSFLMMAHETGKPFYIVIEYYDELEEAENVKANFVANMEEAFGKALSKIGKVK